MKNSGIVILAMCLLLCGCNRQQNEITPIDTSKENDPVLETTLPETSEKTETFPETKTELTTEEQTETFNPVEEKPELVLETKENLNFDIITKEGVQLSESELEEWNERFDDFLAVHFLVTEYDTPEDISWLYLFHDGVPVDLNTGEMLSRDATEEELTLLKERFEEWRELPDWVTWGYKIERKQIESVLEKYMGLTLEESNKRGIKHFSYLPETDTYYFSMNDPYAYRYKITSGAYLEDGSLLLHWEIDDDLYSGQNGYVRLRKDGNVWHIFSNVILQFCNHRTEPFICVYKGTVENVKETVLNQLHEIMAREGISNLVEAYDPLTPFSVVAEDTDYRLIFSGGGMRNYAKDQDPEFIQMLDEVDSLLRDKTVSLTNAVVFIPWDQISFAFGDIDFESITFR